MLFNSLQFAVFFVIVYSCYLMLSHKWQNRMLLAASYVFYGAWDWRFLFLIFASTILDYICGLKISGSKDDKRKKLFLFFSIFGNLSILGFFKYFDFFASSFQALLAHLGISTQPHLLQIILPVGISFYTFQTMSYTIDIYRNELKPTRKFLDFALFVAFFPQLVAGPIERAKHLLPQILSPRRFRLDYFYEGLYLIFWGLFQKMFVADNLARIIDPEFAAGPPYNGTRVLLASYAFAIQIFCDFAGYSNIARGIGRVMGFDIMVNFNVPYLATCPREFWKRWHISLSSWLRDYLYIPLGGNKKGALITYRNLAITMLLGGLWHGAAWTFILWGAYHGILLIVYRTSEPLLAKIPIPRNNITAKILFLVKLVLFFHLICIGWLIFRAQSIGQAFEMLSALFCNFKMVDGLNLPAMIGPLIGYSVLLFAVQLFQYNKNDLFAVFRFKPVYQIFLYLIMFYSILLLGVVSGEEFIYFQF